MFLIIVVAIYSYLNTNQRLDTIRGLSYADNIGYAMLCGYSGVMLMTKRKFFPIAILLVIFGTLISGKRGAIVGMAVSTIPLIQFVRTTYTRDVIKKILFIVVVIVAAVLAMHFFGHYFDAALERFENIREDGGSGRNMVFISYWDHFKSSNIINMIFGHGLYAGAWFSGSKHAFIHVMAHNDWLELLYDFGMVSVILYALIFIKMASALIRNRKNRNAYYYMLAMSFVIWLTKSALSSTFLMDVNTIYLYMTAAYALAKLEMGTAEKQLSEPQPQQAS